VTCGDSEAEAPAPGSAGIPSLQVSRIFVGEPHPYSVHTGRKSCQLTCRVRGRDLAGRA
jgi:hypothetical protein